MDNSSDCDLSEINYEFIYTNVEARYEMLSYTDQLDIIVSPSSTTNEMVGLRLLRCAICSARVRHQLLCNMSRQVIEVMYIPRPNLD